MANASHTPLYCIYPFLLKNNAPSNPSNRPKLNNHGHFLVYGMQFLPSTTVQTHPQIPIGGRSKNSQNFLAMPGTCLQTRFRSVHRPSRRNRTHGRLRRFLPPQVVDLIVASGSEKQLESHRREITALFCDLRGFTGFTESADAEDVMALLRDYHAAIGEIIIKYNGTLERYAGDGVMVVFNDPVPVENPALQAVLMALELRDALGALTQTWSRLGHEIGFGIGIAHGFATLGTIGYEGRFDYAAIGTVSNVASRLCDEAKPGQILISARVLTKVETP